MENITIRELRIDDADHISRILKAITKTDVNINFQRIAEEQARSDEIAGFIAEIKGRVVGFMISYILSGGFGIDKSAWIANFGVDPKFMGQGIGQSLAKEIFGFYKERGIKDIYTSVEWDSTDLLSFFKTLGFNRSKFINLRKSID